MMVFGDGAEKSLDELADGEATALSRLMYWSMSKGVMEGDVSCDDDDDSCLRVAMMSKSSGNTMEEVRKPGCWSARSGSQVDDVFRRLYG